MPYRPPRQSDKIRLEAERWGNKGIALLSSAKQVADAELGSVLDQAISCFERSLNLVADEPQIFYHLAFAHSRTSEIADDLESEISHADAAIGYYRRLMNCENTLEESLHVCDLFSDVLVRRAKLATQQKEKEAYLDEAIRVLQSALANERADKKTVAGLSGFLGLIFVEKAESGAPGEQVQLFKRAAETFERASEHRPNDLTIRYNLGKALLDVGECSDDPDEKMKWLNAAVETYAQAMLASQDETIVGEQTVPPFLKYNFAWPLSLTGDQQRAMEVLTELVAANEASPDEIEDDPDFDSLRDRADFQKLVGNG